MLRYYAAKFDKNAQVQVGPAARGAGRAMVTPKSLLVSGANRTIEVASTVAGFEPRPASRPDRTGSHKLGAAGRAAAWLPTGMRPGPVGANLARKLDWQVDSDFRAPSLSASGRRMAEFELQSRGMGKGLSWLGICGLNGSSAV
jgi:hypothetical protein